MARQGRFRRAIIGPVESFGPLDVAFPDIDDPFVADIRRRRWDDIEDFFVNATSVSGPFMLRVVRMARRHDRLGRLFPGTVMGALTLSRSSGEASDDCPSIDVDRAGLYGVAASTYPKPMDGPHPPQLGDLTTDPAEAIETAAAGLPPTWTVVWIGCPSRHPMNSAVGIE